jgi:hypothetical protein
MFALRTGERWALPDDAGETPLVLEGTAGKLARR